MTENLDNDKVYETFIDFFKFYPQYLNFLSTFFIAIWLLDMD